MRVSRRRGSISRPEEMDEKGATVTSGPLSSKWECPYELTVRNVALAMIAKNIFLFGSYPFDMRITISHVKQAQAAGHSLFDLARTIEYLSLFANYPFSIKKVKEVLHDWPSG